MTTYGSSLSGHGVTLQKLLQVRTSSSVLYHSEDGLMRLFASERIAKVMDRLGFEDGERIKTNDQQEHERAQRKVENDFGIRKHLFGVA